MFEPCPAASTEVRWTLLVSSCLRSTNRVNLRTREHADSQNIWIHPRTMYESVAVLFLSTHTPHSKETSLRNSVVANKECILPCPNGCTSLNMQRYTFDLTHFVVLGSSLEVCTLHPCDNHQNSRVYAQPNPAGGTRLKRTRPSPPQPDASSFTRWMEHRASPAPRCSFSAGRGWDSATAAPGDATHCEPASQPAPARAESRPAAPHVAPPARQPRPRTPSHGALGEHPPSTHRVCRGFR